MPAVLLGLLGASGWLIAARFAGRWTERDPILTGAGVLLWASIVTPGVWMKTGGGTEFWALFAVPPYLTMAVLRASQARAQSSFERLRRKVTQTRRMTFSSFLAASRSL